MNHIAPQEDRLELPRAWQARLLPWRGRRDGKPREPAGPEAIARHRKRLTDYRGELEAALATTGNAPYAAAAAAYLAGEPDARGAAAVGALLTDYDSHSESALDPEFDRWLEAHGLPFAVCAAVERLAVAPLTGGYYGGRDIPKRTVAEHDLVHPETAVSALWNGGIASVRALLAAASDDEYAAVVAAVAKHRDTAAKRVTAMVLLPGEQDWVLEACKDFGQRRAYPSNADMLFWHSASRPEHLKAAGLAKVLMYRNAEIDTLAAVLAGLGAEAMPFLLAADTDLRSYNDVDRRLLYRAIAMVPTAEATALVFERLELPNVWEAAAEAAARFPVRALRAAARLAPTASAGLRPWLAAAANLVNPEHRAHLDDTDRAVIADLLADTGRVPDAAPGDLPALLAAPPWTRKRPKRKRVAIPGLEAPAQSHLVWAAGEREAWGRIRSPYDLDEGYWHGVATVAPDDWRIVSFLAYGERTRAEPLLDRWDAAAHAGKQTELQRVLARFGERAIDRVLVHPAADHTCHELPGPILNQTAARIAAERLARLKGARPSAARWLDRHGLAAVPYLVPDALGADKKRREYAETALGRLAASHGHAAVAAAAERFGPEAAQAIRDLLDTDPLEPRGKVPAPASWAVPLILPQVLLKGGEKALPDEAIPHLISVLALGTPDDAYPGVQVVAEACDRASLTRFSRALFERWLAVGAPAKEGWAFTQLAHFADDATVWDLAPRIREWPGQNQHKRAVTGLEVLGAIGTEEALRAIQTIAAKVKFKALKEEAGRQITLIAEGLGLSREQLADRLVPDFGLGDAAALVLDYGPRRFHVAFDEQLQPFVTDEDGKARKSLPKPGAKDDPQVAEESYQRFKALKKELRTVAADQVRRLEQAMVAARNWSTEEFRRYFAEHALNAHLARRLVWIAEADGTPLGFRIAEDGTYSDVEDESVALPEHARVRVAHPVHLGDATAAWAGVLADYEVLQPFDQLNRPVMEFTDDELATGRLKRFEGTTVDVGRVLGLTQRGWNRAAPEDAGVAPGIAFPLPDGGCVTVALEPGIVVGYPREAPEQVILSARLALYERYSWPEADQPDEFPTGIDPLTASEILASLARLTGTA